MQSLIDSFDQLSCSDASLSPYNSDDEVVWELSSSFASLVAQDSADDDDDFVLLSKPGPAPTTLSINTTNAAYETLPHSPASPLAPALRAASATPIPTVAAASVTHAETTVFAPVSRDQRKLERAARRKAARQRKKEAVATATSADAVAKATPLKDAKQAKKERKRAARKRGKERRKLQKQQAKKQAKCGPSAKEKSTGAKVFTEATLSEMYKEASIFISTFLASSGAKRDSVCRLVLLQSLIVELGLTPRESSEFPTTIRAARKFVKAHVFLNVKEYIAHREEGQAALKRLLYPSKSALIKDIKHKGNPASLKWVKQQGLNVLLVSCYHH